jgi:hypothetical protein
MLAGDGPSEYKQAAETLARGLPSMKKMRVEPDSNGQ